MPELEAPRNAIDTALIKLNNACHYLELSRPSKKDVKSASDAAKDAADILKASLVLLDHDCYTVQDPPQAPGTPLFKPSGEPTKAAAVPEAPTPELPALGYIEVEVVETVRKFKVGDRVKATSSSLEDKGALGSVMEDDGSPEDESPYFVHFDNDGESPESGSWQDAHDLELVTTPGLNDPDARAEIINEAFPAGNKTAQKKVFEERLSTLEDIFCDHSDATGDTSTYSDQLKAFRPHREAWKAAWTADPKAAWKALLVKIADATEATAETVVTWSSAA